jgi:M6 family metalloprotease-like protein
MTRKGFIVCVLFVIVGAMLMCDTAWAVTANPSPIKVQQPDGTEITIRVRGDERYNWLEDIDGYLVKRESDGSYVYAKVENNMVVPTAWKVGQVDPPSVGLQKGVRPPRSLPPMLSTSPVSSIVPNSDGPLAAPGSPAPPKRIDPPIAGPIYNLVVLCRFSDQENDEENTYYLNPADYDVLFNNAGPDPLAPTGSVKDYFTATSYGDLEFNSVVLVEWIVLPEDQVYYTDGQFGFGFYPNNAQRMVEDALNEVEGLFNDGTINVTDPNEENYVNLDSDGDGFIDAIDFIHSGYGAEFDGDFDKIWSHMWALDEPWVSESSGLMVQDYHTEPALYGNEFYPTEITHIGVICHETGHFFGLPDLYDTDGSSWGIGQWGLMGDSWGFTRNQYFPGHPCAWSKIFLGWVTPTVIDEGGLYDMREVENYREIYRIDMGFPTDEYLLIENRQPMEGSFDDAIGYNFERDWIFAWPQGGLMIWHIDDLAGDFDLNNVNNNEGYPGQAGWPENGMHYRVALLQADGAYDLERNTWWGSDKMDPYYEENNWWESGVDEIAPDTIPSTDTYQNGEVNPTDIFIFWISDSHYDPWWTDPPPEFADFADPNMSFYLWGYKPGRVLNYTKNIEYETIQAAIDAADNGDEIIANAKGAYFEHVDFKGKDVLVRSGDVDNPADQTIYPETTFIIGVRDSVVKFQSGEGPDCILKGFTLGHGRADYGGGIYCESASPTITNCIIRRNRAKYDGGGIFCESGSPTIIDCTIEDNTAGGDGGGIFCDSGSLTITDCAILSNETDGYGGGVICISSGDLTITDSVLRWNRAGFDGGGIMCEYVDPTITSSIIEWNSSDFNGGGIECFAASTTIIDCIIQENWCTYYGGGIDLWESPAFITGSFISYNEAWSGGGINDLDSSGSRIESCQIFANISFDVGGGIAYYYNSAPTLKNCVFADNSSGQAGGAVYLWASDVEIKSCTVVDNTGVNKFGGIYCDTEEFANATITNSILWNNGDDLTGCSATYSCIEDLDAGEGNIHEDPNLIGPYYIWTSETLPQFPGFPPFDTIAKLDIYLSFDGGYNVGQDANSPCIDAGFGAAQDLVDELAIDFESRQLTTLTYHAPDVGTLDMGYHQYALDPNDVPKFNLTTNALPDDPEAFIIPDVDEVPYDQYTVIHLEGIPPWSPDDPYYVTWTGTDDDTSTELINTVTLGGDPGNDPNIFVEVEFQLVPKHRLTVTIIGTNGFVEISDPDNLEETIPILRARYYEGTVVQLIGVPDEGYRVKQWIGSDNDPSWNSNSTVTMTSSKVVSVEFEPDVEGFGLYTDVSSDNGDIYVTLRDGTETTDSLTLHTAGTVVPLRAAPDDPENRVKWTGTDDDIITGLYNTVTMPEGSKEVFAKFYTPRILHVAAKGEYTDIQRAIDDANDDDIIVIHPGEWETNTPGNGWVIEGKAITLTSTEPDNPAVVAETILSNRIQIEDVGPDTVINGLTILEVHYFGADGIDGPETGDDGSNGSETFGAGLRIGYNNRLARRFPGFPAAPASPTVLNCVIQGCSNIGGNGGNGNNGSEEVPGGDGGWGGRAGGGAVFVGPLCNPTFKNCQFLDNFVDGGDGGNGGDAAPDNFGGVGGSWDNIPPWPDWTYGPYEPYWKYSGYGGAVFCDVESAALFEDCVFSGNHSEGSLSGVNGLFMRYDIGPDQVYNIENFGGAIYCEADSNVLFKGCTITDNYADTSIEPFNDDQYVSYGGAVAFGEGANIRFEDCLFENNSACVGGSLYWEGSFATIADCNVVSNSAYQGGGVYFVGGETNISRCIFERNEADFDFAQGGGIFCFDSNSVFVDSHINDNQTTGSGGGLYLSDNVLVQIRNCLITNNSAGDSGGGITSSWYSNTSIVNSTIADNIAERILPTQEEVIGGGLLCSFNSNVDVIDSIIWGNNSDTVGPQIAVAGTDPYNPLPATLRISYSDVQGGVGEIFVDVGQNDPNEMWGIGNINEDPLFATGLLGDYYLSHVQAGQSADSPCVDAGSTDVRTAGMDVYLTRTDNQLDQHVVDMGFHRRFAVVPDMCRVADMERDGIIDLPDLLILAEYWLSLGCDEEDGSDFGWCHAADIDKDQSVDFYDYAFLTYCWKIDDTNPPQPNPMEWKDPPYPDGVGAISMTAETATDAWWRNDEDHTYIQYYFECSDSAFDSVWLDEPEYTATGLVNGQQYSFRVQARDGRRREGPLDENRTEFSEWASATAGAETIPPEPDPSLWATLEHDGIDGIPEPSGPDSIKMAAYTATDPSGPVEYYFRYTEPDGVTPGQGDGHDSGWQLSNIYEDTGLTIDQFYTYVVRTRDAWHNETQESVPFTVLLDEWDDIPPDPDPPEWEQAPLRVPHASGYWHTMSVVPATDDSGVEYHFICVDDNDYSSGWQSVDGVDPDGNPTPPNVYWVYVGGQYIYFSYTVEVRDLSANQNTTGLIDPPEKVK